MSSTPARTRTSDRQSTGPLKLRYSRVVFVPLVMAATFALPLVLALKLWGLLIVAIFIALAYGLARIGADITPQRVVVHGVLASSVVERADLVGFSIPDERHVHLVRTDGSTVRLPTARPRDLPRLREALFGRFARDNAAPEE